MTDARCLDEGNAMGSSLSAPRPSGVRICQREAVSPRIRSICSLWAALLLILPAIACAPRAAGPSGAPAPGAAPPAPGATTGAGAVAQPPPARKVSFAIAVAVPDQGQPWVFAPQGAGYFAEEGLEVEVLPN